MSAVGAVVVGDDGSRVADVAVMWAADEAVPRGVALTIVGCSSMSARPRDHRAAAEATESAVRNIRYASNESPAGTALVDRSRRS